jgi:multiple sugar transport system permease protein
VAEGHAGRIGAGSREDAVAAPIPAARAVPPSQGISQVFEDERVLGLVLLLPTVVLLGLFIAYPFVKGVSISLTSATVGDAGVFIGFDNFRRLLNDTIFQRAAWNTVVYTVIATIGKLALGLWLALLLNRHFRGQRLVRASMLLPFIIPTVLSTFAWKWMFDPTFSLLNWSLYNLGFITTRIGWLTEPVLALGSEIVVNISRGIPL